MATTTRPDAPAPTSADTRYPAPSAAQSGRIFTVVGFVLAGLALLFLPIVLGPVGAVLGFIGYKKGDRLGLWAGIAAIAATFVGMALGALMFHAVRHSSTAR